MNKILLVGLIFLFYKSNSQNINPSESEIEIERKQRQKAKIKKCSRYHYKYPKGELGQAAVLYEIRLFDKNGRILEIGNYNNNIHTTKLVCKYDSSGNIIVDSFLDRDGTILITTINKYDKNGNRIEVISIDWKYTWSGYKILYCYDTIGNLISETNYDREKDTFFLDNKTIYLYDSSNHKLKRERYDNKNDIINWSDYKFDKKGSLISEILYWHDNRARYEEYWQYDSLEYWHEIKQYRDSKFLSHEMSKYSFNNLLLENIKYDSCANINTITQHQYNIYGKETDWFLYDDQLKVIRNIKTFYNENKFISERKGYDSDGNIYFWYSYTSDLYGNKLVEIEYYDNHQPSSVIKYIYEYY